MIELTPNLPQFRRSGRWTQTDSNALFASWASASISFVLASSSLSIRLGPRTKDISGLDEATLVCTLSNPLGSHNDDHRRLQNPNDDTRVLTFSNVEPGVLSLFDRLDNGQKRIVEITLVHWSCELELVSIVVDRVS
jgi:hypothetical protein